MLYEEIQDCYEGGEKLEGNIWGDDDCKWDVCEHPFRGRKGTKAWCVY